MTTFVLRNAHARVTGHTGALFNHNDHASFGIRTWHAFQRHEGPHETFRPGRSRPDGRHRHDRDGRLHDAATTGVSAFTGGVDNSHSAECARACSRRGGALPPALVERLALEFVLVVTFVFVVFEFAEPLRRLVLAQPHTALAFDGALVE